MTGLLDSSDYGELRAIIDRLGVVAFVVEADPDGAFRIAAINDRHETVSGMRHEAVAGRRLEECLSPATAAAVAANYRRCLEQRAAIDYRESLELPSGPTYWHTTLVPFFDGAGRIFRILGTSVEISETVHLELETRYQSTLLSAYLEESPDGILVGDADNHLKTWNRRFLEIWDISEEVMAAGEGVRALASVRPQLADPDGFVDRVLELYRHLDEEEHGRRIALRDGRTLERFSRGLRDEQGAYWGRIWFYRDITQQLADAEALRRSEARLRATVDSAADAIVTVNERGRIEGFNPAAERIFGYRAEEVVGGDVSPLLPPELAERHHEWLGRYVSGEPATVMGQERELFGRRKDGSLFPI
ncbi:MAG TPA: PAS domain S-box protein, partial [Gammaproteobacteria bacterium]|nr:PAS domain S-box protein [Gammaproteobacteria bacterium]